MVAFFALKSVLLFYLAALKEENFDLVNFRFIHGKTIEEHDKFYINETLKLLRHEKFNFHRKTVFYTHGWIEKFDFGSIPIIADAYIRRNDHNIVIIDWGPYSDGAYFFHVLPRVVKIGNILSRIFLKLFESGLNIETVHIVGHSFGAHMSGIIGRKVIALSNGKYKIKRISGLDPAGPGFYPPVIASPISKDDAEFVDLIHTDTFWVGTEIPTGTVDFYPNDGKLQPGCPPINVIGLKHILRNYCSHMKSYFYWGESVADLSNTAFLSLNCDNWNHFIHGHCDYNPTNQMGINAHNRYPGNYYLTTRPIPMYTQSREVLKHLSNYRNDTFFNINQGYNYFQDSNEIENR